MNARSAKARREADEQKFRADVLALVEAQKGVIGALVRQLDSVTKDVERLKRQASPLESLVIQ